MRLPDAEIHETFIRSSGPGGQNVNKVATAVQLRVDIANSPSLTDRQKSRMKRIASHLMTRSGEIVIEASRYRTQAQNRADARRRLEELLEEASKPAPPRRKPTRPTRASVEKRLNRKSRRSRIKKLRRIDGES